MRHTIRFFLNGQPVTPGGFDPACTLLDWLRSEPRLTGTKEGCAEGDCGACTVLLGRMHGGKITYQAINACIRLLATVDGCHVVTVEYLRSSQHLHPVQQALLELHGSQCGFCTPGMVMSLAALWLSCETPPSRARIEEALAGNLCRCTGYGPILAALDHAYASGRHADDPLRARLAETDCQLAASHDADVIELAHEGRYLWAPATADQLAALAAANPDAVLIAGASDVGLEITKQLQRPERMLTLARVADLDGVTTTENRIMIGALTTLRDVRRVLGALDPQIDELMRRFGSEQIRNTGTIGGSIANGSPIGDLAPVLIALEARLILRHGQNRREIAVEKFFIAYGQQDRKPGEFIETVIVPIPAPQSCLHVSKVSKRYDEDISAICGAFRLDCDDDGVVQQAILAFGGMAATPKRAAAAEAALSGKRFTAETASQAADALGEDFSPLDDLRASARYRLLVAGNLIRRFQLELQEKKTFRVRIPGAF